MRGRRRFGISWGGWAVGRRGSRGDGRLEPGLCMIPFHRQSQLIRFYGSTWVFIDLE